MVFSAVACRTRGCEDQLEGSPAEAPAAVTVSDTGTAWQAQYWKQQADACRGYDLASCVFKVILLLGNVRRSLEHGEHSATAWAAGAAVLVFVSVLLMWLREAQYTRHRRLVMWSHLVAISLMMASSMPQFLSGRSSDVWAHKALVLLFKMGVTWPIMAALMHRLPWQDLALLCTVFCAWLSCTWPRTLCHNLQHRASDAHFISSLAAGLDTLTGLGMDMPGVGSTSTAGATGSLNPHSTISSSQQLWPGLAANSATLPAAVEKLAAMEQYWAPLAHHVGAACAAGRPSSSTHSSSGISIGLQLALADCQQLQLGQCMAVTTTLTLWVGVLVILFFVVLGEQHSKWRWWHSSAARLLARPPQVYAPTSVLGFLGLRLLYLHILLDIPLMLLWVGTSTYYRQPTAVLGDFNLW